MRGYRVLETNAWFAGNELDIVVRRGRRLVFCEVKSKTAEAYGDPAEMVTPEKVRRVRRAAEVWLATHPAFAECEARFDVVVVRGKVLECIREAF